MKSAHLLSAAANSASKVRSPRVATRWPFDSAPWTEANCGVSEINVTGIAWKPSGARTKTQLWLRWLTTASAGTRHCEAPPPATRKIAWTACPGRNGRRSGLNSATAFTDWVAEFDCTADADQLTLESR